MVSGKNLSEEIAVNQGQIRKFTDLVAISFSALCFIHCLFTPVALILVPIFGSAALEGEFFHRFMLLLILPASFIALFLGCRRHKDISVMILGIAGFSLLVFSAYLGEQTVGDTGEKVLTSAGGLTMVLGHLRNFRLCRDDACEHHDN